MKARSRQSLPPRCTATVCVIAVARTFCPSDVCASPSSTSGTVTSCGQVVAERLESVSAGACPSTLTESPLRVLRSPEGQYDALVHVPQAADVSVFLPLLIYLHGSGQSGNNLVDTLGAPATGSPPALLHCGEAPKELANKFITVAPQTPSGWPVDRLGAFLDYILNLGPDVFGAGMDGARIYLAGHSIGGTAALRAAAELRIARRQQRPAAIVPVAPRRLPDYAGLRGMPVWLHHGANDIIAPVSGSDEIAQELRHLNISGDLVRYDRYLEAPTAPGRDPRTHLGHASQIPAFSNQEVYRWLLQHSLPSEDAE